MNESLSVDVAVVGAGFGGSLTALILNRIGFRVAVLERGRHPRFALGESSTPTADLVLRDLAGRYDLPFLNSLSRYGDWLQSYPDIIRGPKRGFSYFSHQANHEFECHADHRNELLVAASHSQASADSHWLRCDVDSFFVQQLESAGISYFDQTEVTVEDHRPSWQLVGSRDDGTSLFIQAAFLIDATGEASFLPKTFGLKQRGDRMCTNSQAVFAHMEGVLPWETMLQQQDARTIDHPFPCDAAALHHLLHDGWMWQLRFDNGVTSVGIATNSKASPLNPKLSATDQWNQTLKRYPSLAKQFASSRIVAPKNEICRTGRLQRQWSQLSGLNWALLPHTAGFVDPLYSSGIAHTVCGIERLCHLLEHHWQRDSLEIVLDHYASTIRSELDLLDELVAGSYAAMNDFSLFVPYSMLYFAAATTYETNRLRSSFTPEMAILCADNQPFREVVTQVTGELRRVVNSERSDRTSCHFFETVATAIAPYNTAGLCDTSVNNMYRYTAVEKSHSHRA